MTPPSPADPVQSPVWENYVVAQAAQAALGQIPVHTLALGVSVSANQVQLVFRLSKSTDQDTTDIEDIVSELEALLGSEVSVGTASEVMAHGTPLEPTGLGGVRWIFNARLDAP